MERAENILALYDRHQTQPAPHPTINFPCPIYERPLYHTPYGNPLNSQSLGDIVYLRDCKCAFIDNLKSELGPAGIQINCFNVITGRRVRDDLQLVAYPEGIFRQVIPGLLFIVIMTETSAVCCVDFPL